MDTIRSANSSQSINLIKKMVQNQMKNYGINPAYFMFPFDEWAIFHEHIDSDFKNSHHILTDGKKFNLDEHRTVRSFRISATDCWNIHGMSDQQLLKWVQDRHGAVHDRTDRPARILNIGEKLEAPAIQEYISVHKVDVRKVRLLVNPSFPFLICQADGIAYTGNEPSHIVEVKIMPKTFTNQRRSPRFERLRDGSWRVVKSSKVYMQVQILMFVSNLPFADVVLYNEKSSSIYTIKVKRDNHFIHNLINDIYCKLQSIILPAMVEKFVYRT